MEPRYCESLLADSTKVECILFVVTQKSSRPAAGLFLLRPRAQNSCARALLAVVTENVKNAGFVTAQEGKQHRVCFFF